MFLRTLFKIQWSLIISQLYCINELADWRQTCENSSVTLSRRMDFRFVSWPLDSKSVTVSRCDSLPIINVEHGRLNQKSIFSWVADPSAVWKKYTNICTCRYIYKAICFWLVIFSSTRLRATHLYISNNGGMSDDTKHIPCSCHLMYTAGLTASSSAFIIIQKLIHEC
jgi:hypothetical protein